MVGKKGAWSAIRVLKGSSSGHQVTRGPQSLEPLTTLPRPFPQHSVISPGSDGGAGSPTPPPLPRPALPSSARSGPAQPSPPALTAPTAPAAPPLPRLLPHPLPAEAAPPDPSSAGPGGPEHVGPLHSEPEATLRPTSSRRRSFSRPWEVGPLCAQRELRHPAPPELKKSQS